MLYEVITEVEPDVPLSNGSENSVRDCMGQNVGVRVPFEPVRVRYFDPSQHELPAFNETMDIIANSHSIHKQTVAR